MVARDLYPDLTAQGKNMTELLKKFVEQQTTATEEHERAIFASEAEQKRRYDICQVCDYYHKQSNRCRKCGCWLKYKVKPRVSECPIKKW